MKSYDVTIKKKFSACSFAGCYICFLKFYKMKLGHLVEIYLWLHLEVKGLKEYTVVQSRTSGLTLVSD